MAVAVLTGCKTDEPADEPNETSYTVPTTYNFDNVSYGGQTDRLNMLTALLKLRQVCTHPGIVEEFKGLGIESAKFNMLKEKSFNR